MNVEEYVSETLSALAEMGEPQPSVRDLAESIADIQMAQGLHPGKTFEQVVEELTPQVAYYLG